MTADQLSKMTDEQKRIKIAELCGLDVIYDPVGPQDRPDAWKNGWFTPLAAKERRVFWPSSSVVKVVPDYLNSLDAMHEVKKCLKCHSSEKLTFVLNLARTLGMADPSTSAYNGLEDYWLISNATPSQEADAFLMTMLP